MSAQPTQATRDDDPGQQAPGQQATDTHAYRGVLHGLIEIGADLARLLHQQAAAQARAAQQDAALHPAQVPAPPPAPGALVSIAAAFDQVARAVRRSIALARTLNEPAKPALDPARRRAAARKRILREVEDVIGRKAHDSSYADCDNAEVLAAELHERLDAPDLDDDLSHRPVAEIITEIRRDLGLDALPGARPWKRRTPEDIAQLCARAAAPSRLCKPGAGPQDIRSSTAQPSSIPPVSTGRSPANPVPAEPSEPAAVPRAGLAPTHAGSDAPDDPADLIATILRYLNARPQPMAPAARSLSKTVEVRHADNAEAASRPSSAGNGVRIRPRSHAQHAATHRP